jgi:acetylornithine/N-succinyldiaminopimelate aminotransferase
MKRSKTIETEEKTAVPFFKKIPISIERGEGVYVWDEEGNKYLDFTSGWGVTCIGHAHPVITEALTAQSRRIIQNPNSGLTYSPPRAALLSLMTEILPENLTRVFFSNSGAESNDAAIKLARKVTGRTDIISTNASFHGRTISTASATGQSVHRNKFNPLMPNNRFVDFDDINALEAALDENVAAFIVEPIQGEGGVVVPSADYLENASRLCRSNNSLLILDEIQTGFCRTGAMFAVSNQKVQADFITMAKGIAGGFPFGAFAMSEAVAEQIEIGDHGGTYCGNPLGCAVAHAVIRHLIDEKIADNAARMGNLAMDRMTAFKVKYPEAVSDARGRGLLMALEFADENTAAAVNEHCMAKRLFVRLTQGRAIRIFPALNITKDEVNEGFDIIEQAIISVHP